MDAFEIVMINDCAFVGETLLKYLPLEMKRKHVKRGRGFWDKTFGLAYKILKTKADLYHVHYLLQDCYIAIHLRKRPLIGHAHGSDLRTGLKHPFWSRIVRYNLEKCDRIIVSTPDILTVAKRLREDAEYLPNPVDSELFHPKPFTAGKEKKRVLIASGSNWATKGTDLAIRALSRIRNEVDVSIIGYGVDFYKTLALASSLGLRLNVLPKIDHGKINEYYWNADVVIDQFKLGSLGMVSLEAISCGRPVITYVSSEYSEYRDFPLKDVNTEEEIADAINRADVILWKKEYKYLEKHHSVETIIKKLLQLYEEVIPKTK